MKDFPYKATFSSVVKPIVSKEKNLQLAKASLEQLRQYIPNIDLDQNYDLLGIAMPLFNVNYFNKNDDGVDTAFALKIYKSFINKFINIGHSRDRIVGVMLSSHITKFDTDEPLTEEEVKDTKDIFNVTVGGVLWRLVNEDLAELIEESNSILSDNFDVIKSSLEVGFTNFEVVVCPPNSRSLIEGKIIENAEEKAKLSKNLRAFGGTGKLEDGSRVYRLLSGEGLGLGGAVTESPAAELNAIAVPEIKGESDTSEALSSVLDKWKESKLLSMQDILILQSISSENKISQSENNNVITNKNLNSKQDMKIKDIKDITDETLKEVKAATIVEFVEEKLKAASEQFAKDKKEKETLAQEVQSKYDTLVKTHETITKELENVKANLQKLEDERVAKEKQEKFTVRMASFEDKFELTEEELAVVGSQIKDLNDEQYKTVEANLHILLKNKDKQIIAEQKKVKEAKASENKETKTAEQTVDKALETAQTTSKEVAATTSVKTETLREKYAKAFAPDQFGISK